MVPFTKFEALSGSTSYGSFFHVSVLLSLIFKNHIRCSYPLSHRAVWLLTFAPLLIVPNKAARFCCTSSGSCNATKFSKGISSNIFFGHHHQVQVWGKRPEEPPAIPLPIGFLPAPKTPSEDLCGLCFFLLQAALAQSSNGQ